MCSHSLQLYRHFTPVWAQVQSPNILKGTLNKLFKNKSGIATHTIVI